MSEESILAAKDRQRRAQQALKNEREIIAASVSYLYAINQMIRRLEDFTASINTEIAKKWRFSNRLKWVTAAKLVARFNTTTVMGRLCVSTGVVLGSWLIISGITMSFCCLPLLLGLIATDMFAPTALPYVLLAVAIICFSILLVIMVGVLANLLLHFDSRSGVARFEEYTPAYCLSHSVINEFSTVKNKINSFQELNAVITDN